MSYQPIEDYGIIGNMRTTALVGKNGSIDCFCLPRHDSPSIFAAILDDEKGGYFESTPAKIKLFVNNFTGPKPICWSPAFWPIAV